MIYTAPTSCPICLQSAAVPTGHRCQDYYDRMYTYTTSILSGENTPDVPVPKRASISLDLMMDIYAILKNRYDTLELAERLKEELEVE
jgi:hypothetical protein